MPTVRLWTDAEVSTDPRIKAIFDDIRATASSVPDWDSAIAKVPVIDGSGSLVS